MTGTAGQRRTAAILNRYLNHRFFAFRPQRLPRMKRLLYWYAVTDG
jgi:hypothetical protein